MPFLKWVLKINFNLKYHLPPPCLNGVQGDNFNFILSTCLKMCSNISSENLKERDHLQDLNVNRITLKCILKKWFVRVREWFYFLWHLLSTCGACVCVCAQFNTLFSQPLKLKIRIHEAQISRLLFFSASTKGVSQNLKTCLQLFDIRIVAPWFFLPSKR